MNALIVLGTKPCLWHS